MFWDLLQTNANKDADQPALLSLQASTNWNQLKRLADQRLEQLRDAPFDRCVVKFAPSPESLATLAALDRLGSSVFLVDPNLDHDRIRQIMDQFHLDVCYADDTPPQLHKGCDQSISFEDGQPSSVTILTSGTTGNPKAACHSWQSLMRPVRKVDDSSKRWYLSYRPHLYAGLQVLLQAFLNHSAIVVPASTHVEHQYEVLRHRKVQCISGTPSFFRKLFLTFDSDAMQAIPLEQITLGGELVDQPILDQLKSTFPNARITHIYATTELGRCFSVTDGLAGFPRSFLKEAYGGVELRIHEDQLWVRSANSMTAYDQFVDQQNRLQRSDDGWTCTGDLVRVADDRVFFAGRKTDMINVGGNKVNPVLVENAILQVEGVLDVRVFGTHSTIAGQLVACDIVTSLDDREETKQRVIQHCLQVLDKYQRPRFVNVVDQIELSSAGKKIRSSDAP